MTYYPPWGLKRTVRGLLEQIKSIVSHKAALELEINESLRVPFKKKAMSDVLPAQNHIKRTPNHGVTQFYCMLCKK